MDQPASLSELFDEFRLARQSAEPSPHSERAARSDFAAIHSRLRDQLGVEDPTRANRTYRVLERITPAKKPAHRAS